MLRAYKERQAAEEATAADATDPEPVRNCVFVLCFCMSLYLATDAKKLLCATGAVLCRDVVNESHAVWDGRV